MRTDWKEGDKAFYVKDLGQGVDEVEVKYGAWQLGHGDWVVGIKGRVGGYAADRFHDTREAAEKAAKKMAAAWAKRRAGKAGGA